MKKRIVFTLTVCFAFFGITYLLFAKLQAPTGIRESYPLIKRAHLSSGWYPQSREELTVQLDRYFSFARKHFGLPADVGRIAMLMAPHAGYRFSGYCAAASYASLMNNGRKNTSIKRVIILAPTHREPLYGIALPWFETYQTPLGDCQVDNNAVRKLTKKHPFIKQHDVYNSEHSLEVHLPFLQHAIQDFEMVPLIVGSLSPKDQAAAVRALESIIDDSTLVVVSSDFIHHGRRFSFNLFDKDISDRIKQLDSAALEAIGEKTLTGFTKALGLSATRGGKDLTICGRNPIKLMLGLLERKRFAQLHSYLTCYYTSAHIEQARTNSVPNIRALFGSIPDEDARSSVSYAGMVFAQGKDVSGQLTGYERRALMALAHETLQNEFGRGANGQKLKTAHLLQPIKSRGLKQQAGAFVTLNKKDGVLRGCIGRITTKQPLHKTVAAMTVSAAFHDGRFSPVKEHELSNLVLDISILTQPLSVRGYQDIVIGRDGVILSKGLKSAVFLPSVAPSRGWDVATTLTRLSSKAGLPQDAWRQGAHFKTFQAHEIHESIFD